MVLKTKVIFASEWDKTGFKVWKKYPQEYICGSFYGRRLVSIDCW